VVTSAPNSPEGRVFEGYKNWWRFEEELDGVRVVRVKTFITANEGFFLRIIDYMSYMLSAFFFAFFEERPDVVISTSPHIFAAIGGLLHSKLRGVPHVIEVRDLWPATIAGVTWIARAGWLYRFLERIELALYRHSARVLTLTNAFCRDLRERGVPEDKIDVVHGGADLELFSPRDRDESLSARYKLDCRFVIGYLGTLGLTHGLENAIRAASLLQDTRATFLFVGAGADRDRLMELSKELDLDNITFAPRQLKEEMPRYWSVCDASLVHLRNEEVFASVVPSKIFESMAMGLPIIYVGPRGEGAQIVEDRGAGIVVSPNDPAELAGAVRHLMEAREEREQLAQASLAAAPRYSRTRQAEESLAVLSRAVQG